MLVLKSGREFTINMPYASIIIRTKNEESGLKNLLESLKTQTFKDYEIIVVDDSSTDSTVEIARNHGCSVYKITPGTFTFGHALNVGLEEANGEVAVIVSAHCLPKDSKWIELLVSEYSKKNNLAGVYGRQVPFPDASPMEKRGLLEAFPEGDSHGRFSNANSSIRLSVWKETKFDETLTGAEDFDWSTKVQDKGHIIEYQPLATVFHSHKERLKGVIERSYRETLGLINIKSPLIKKHSAFGYILRAIRSMALDYIFLVQNPVSFKYLISWTIRIPLYRMGTYYGQYKATK
ncbi:hypothetical protein COB52_03370 [Candidatus Kaiserbacteria bacterium]|nr:MAG: hypothetical protein COB52_03370 [Candidatus Kaiserbacteria bacterium]